MTSPSKRRLEVNTTTQDSPSKRRPNQQQTPTVADDEDLSEINARAQDLQQQEELEEEEDLVVSDSEELLMEDDDSDAEDGDSAAAAAAMRIYRPGIDTMAEDEELVFDPSTYDTYYKFGLGHSCMSMDILPSRDGALKIDGPHTFHIVAGTAAEKASDNAIYVAKCSNIRRTWKLDDDDESDDSDDEDQGGAGNPSLNHSHIKTNYACNSLKVNPELSDIIATFGDDAAVRIYNISAHRQVLEKPSTFADVRQTPFCEMKDHMSEGFAMAWNPADSKQLITGARDQTVRLWEVSASGAVCKYTFEGHTASVEGLSWQKDAPNIFASASADKSIRVWDRRTQKAVSIIPDAHNGDVNVVAFRPLEETNHILSGGDDGLICLRDIRVPEFTLFKQRWHQDAVNVLDWHPTDNSMFLASSYDNCLSIWSMDVEAVESKTQTANQDQELAGIDFYPKQLMFTHQGQDQVAMAMWHRQIQHMIISTAADGFNVFRAENLMVPT